MSTVLDCGHTRKQQPRHVDGVLCHSPKPFEKYPADERENVLDIEGHVGNPGLSASEYEERE